MIYKAVNLHAWRAAESTPGLPGENGGTGEMLFTVTMTVLFPVEEMVGELGVHTAGNEETSAGRSFHSPVNCGTVTHICTHTKIHTQPNTMRKTHQTLHLALLETCFIIRETRIRRNYVKSKYLF